MTVASAQPPVTSRRFGARVTSVATSPPRMKPTRWRDVPTSGWWSPRSPKQARSSRRSDSARWVTSSFSSSRSRGGSSRSRSQPRPAVVVVDRPAVVGVDQREVHELGALVGVGHPGQRQLEQLLAQHQRPHGLGVVVDGGLHERAEPAGAVGLPGEVEDPGFVLRVGVEPRGALLGLAHRLGEVRREPVVVDLADAGERLPDQVGRRRVDVARAGRVAERVGAAAPRLGVAGDREQPGPDVLAALGVVGGQRGHAQRPVLLLVDRPGVHLLGGRDLEQVRVAADLVEGDQPVPAVERGVLDALGHHRAPGLLQPDREVAAGLVDRAQRRCPRAAAARPSGRGGPRSRSRARPASAAGRARRPRRRGARRRGRPSRRRAARRQPRRAARGRPSGSTSTARRSSRRRSGTSTSATTCRLDASTTSPRNGWPPAASQANDSAGAVARSTSAAVTALVASYPVVPSQAHAGQQLVALQDLLHPDRGARADPGAQPPEVPLGVGQPVGVVDAEALHEAAVVQVEQHRVGGLEDVLLLDADRDQRVDVEEPAVVEHLVAVAPAGQPVVLPLQHGRDLGAGVAVPGAVGDREDVVVVAQHLLAVLLAEPQVALREHVVEGLPQHRAGRSAGRGRPSRRRTSARARRRGRGSARPTAGRSRCSGATSAMWLGTTSTTRPRPCCAGGLRERDEAVAAAELDADPGVVEDVVAVGGAGHGLQHRGEVEVADAEVAEVRRDRFGVGEGEAGVQLEAVGRGHCRRLPAAPFRHTLVS